MRALLSVSDREGITELTRGLQDAGIECVATEDTRAHLAEAEVTVAAIPDLADPGAHALGERPAGRGRTWARERPRIHRTPSTSSWST